MKTTHIRYAVLALASLLSACGPSKEKMCEKINASRSVPADSKADEESRYVKCLNAPDDYVRQLYKEALARDKSK